ncbi:MBL fold metallo-hydrolase [Alkaliphilus peptidifermentans]|uniref:Glyoxylase, beta-lactamase superfamily II n=1 Tax=Alkaliphilus peptidifermentans DSM 18978 TaxID=1120976 RepID=A0A1G5L2U7_9FIRM|nr:MBL fold metallo-hydrolase [Alkaliphilus peptidifermentans]SCZ07212.1 Glyoxylase, beta-lactamase superfamily II [Alkaliphilus peptidifermentans DSM 18978]
MIIEKIAAGVYGVNCYIIGDEKTNKAAVIDPGGDGDKILKIIEDNDLELEYILLTHGHGDHIGGVKEIQDKTNAPLYIHEADLYILKDKSKNYSSHMGTNPVELSTDKFLKDDDIIELGELKLKIIHTPGHTPGGVSILVDQYLFTGDTLFANSIGRSDLDGGNHDQLIHSIQTKLMGLNDEITVFPGHGPATRIGIEKLTNPYIR